jgi:hypothetical protein
MSERLVDVVDSKGRVIHTYPVTLDDSGGGVEDAEYQAKALQAAAHGQLVADNELAGLIARMHQSRGGRMEPLDDKVSSNSETKLGLEQSVRERAYDLWDKEGRPGGQTDEYWHRALDQHLRERAYILWQQGGSVEGGADEDWDQTREFQSR